LVKRFSGFIYSAFRIVLFLLWFRNFRVRGQRNYSALGTTTALAISASY
jgi:hypothetical protein